MANIGEILTIKLGASEVGGIWLILNSARALTTLISEEFLDGNAMNWGEQEGHNNLHQERERLCQILTGI